MRGDVAALGEVDTVAADLRHDVLAEHDDFLESKLLRIDFWSNYNILTIVCLKNTCSKIQMPFSMRDCNNYLSAVLNSARIASEEHIGNFIPEIFGHVLWKSRTRKDEWVTGILRSGNKHKPGFSAKFRIFWKINCVV